jgi:hypothetical protein
MIPPFCSTFEASCWQVNCIMLSSTRDSEWETLCRPDLGTRQLSNPRAQREDAGQIDLNVLPATGVIERNASSSSQRLLSRLPLHDGADVCTPAFHCGLTLVHMAARRAEKQSESLRATLAGTVCMPFAFQIHCFFLNYSPTCLHTYSAPVRASATAALTASSDHPILVQ